MGKTRHQCQPEHCYGYDAKTAEHICIAGPYSGTPCHHAVESFAVMRDYEQTVAIVAAVSSAVDTVVEFIVERLSPILDRLDDYRKERGLDV
jgi:transketolase C-terminal domain/subunit